jgi:ribonuclease P protein component
MRFTFPRSHRLIRRRDFDAVYRRKVRVTAGPLILWGAPNDVGHCRLGFAISRRVGRATVRNRIRRLLREAFRHTRHDLPTDPYGYDLVVSVRRHEPATVDDYGQALHRGIEGLQRRWSKRADEPTPPDA